MELEYHIKAWAKAMDQTEYFSLDKSTPEQIRGIWDRLSQTYDDALGSNFIRVERTMEILEQAGIFAEPAIAIDIGCGTGSFTIELAKRCERVYAFDCSPKMLEKLLQKSKKFSNIVPILGDWNELNLETLDPCINLALSCLNPGINNFDALNKMNIASKKYCCYINALGNAVGSNATRNDLQEIIFGRKLNSAKGNSVMFPKNIIEAMGYKPGLWDIPCEWSLNLHKDEAVEEIINDYSRFTYIGDDIRKKIEVYVESNLNDNGLYMQNFNTNLGLLLWQKN